MQPEKFTQLLKSSLVKDSAEVEKSDSQTFNAAVSLIFFQQEKNIELLFIQRASHPKDPWSGHIAFPGGSFEDVDQNLLNTAIRETSEELGVQLAAENYLGNLTPVYGPLVKQRKQVRVAPHVFLLKEQPQLQPNYEVNHAFWIPLDRLRVQQHIRYFEHPSVSGFQMQGIDLGLKSETLLWGLSLEILYRLFITVELPIEQDPVSFKSI